MQESIEFREEMSKNNEIAHCWPEVGKRDTIPQLSNVIFLKITKNVFWRAYDIAKYHSSFHLKKGISSRKTGLQILAMAAMFARDFVSRERYVVPSCAYEDEEILFGGTEISQKEVWKKPH